MSGVASLQRIGDLNEGGARHVNSADAGEGNVRSIRKFGGVVNVGPF
jgi:hypothetical protein